MWYLISRKRSSVHRQVYQSHTCPSPLFSTRFDFHLIKQGNFNCSSLIGFPRPYFSNKIPAPLTTEHPGRLLCFSIASLIDVQKWATLGIRGVDFNALCLWYRKRYSHHVQIVLLFHWRAKRYLVYMIGKFCELQIPFFLFFQKDIFIFLILCVWLFPYMYVCAPPVSVCRSQKEAVRSPGPGVPNSCEPPHEC